MMVRCIAAVSVASPSTIVIDDINYGSRRDLSLDTLCTYAMTVWLCERRAGMRRRPRLPDAPRRRTHSLEGMFELRREIVASQNF